MLENFRFIKEFILTHSVQYTKLVQELQLHKPIQYDTRKTIIRSALFVYVERKKFTCSVSTFTYCSDGLLGTRAVLRTEDSPCAVF